MCQRRRSASLRAEEEPMSIPDPDPLCPGRYVTDGTHLLRIVAALGHSPHSGLIELEDARSLELVLIPREDLRRLRRVRASREPAPLAGTA
jgi:hypothetical protein